jgi:hypothetical protein
MQVSVTLTAEKLKPPLCQPSISMYTKKAAIEETLASESSSQKYDGGACVHIESHSIHVEFKRLGGSKNIQLISSLDTSAMRAVQLQLLTRSTIFI